MFPSNFLLILLYFWIIMEDLSTSHTTTYMVKYTKSTINVDCPVLLKSYLSKSKDIVLEYYFVTRHLYKKKHKAAGKGNTQCNT